MRHVFLINAKIVIMEAHSNPASMQIDVYTPVSSVPAQAIFIPTPLPPRPTSSPSTLHLSYVAAEPKVSKPPQNPSSTPPPAQIITFEHSNGLTAMEPSTIINSLDLNAVEDSAMAQLLTSVEPAESLVESPVKLQETQPEDEIMEDQVVDQMEPNKQEYSENTPEKSLSSVPSPHFSQTPLSSVKTIPSVEVAEAEITQENKFDSAIVEEVTNLESRLLKPRLKPVIRLSRKRRCVSTTLDMIRGYADMLQPVDCVIFVERCALFSKSTRFMECFKTEFLSKILQ